MFKKSIKVYKNQTEAKRRETVEMGIENPYHLYTVREDLIIITRVAYLRLQRQAATRI
jgi:hypothetical protein